MAKCQCVNIVWASCQCSATERRTVPSEAVFKKKLRSFGKRLLTLRGSHIPTGFWSLIFRLLACVIFERWHVDTPGLMRTLWRLYSLYLCLCFFLFFFTHLSHWHHEASSHSSAGLSGKSLVSLLAALSLVTRLRFLLGDSSTVAPPPMTHCATDTGDY